MPYGPLSFSFTDSLSHQTYGYVALGSIPLVYALYTLSRPGKDGEATALENYINKFSYMTAEAEARNTLHTAAVEQAAHDKNLLYTVDRQTNVDLRYPEYVSLFLIPFFFLDFSISFFAHRVPLSKHLC